MTQRLGGHREQFVLCFKSRGQHEGLLGVVHADGASWGARSWAGAAGLQRLGTAWGCSPSPSEG